jgi:hypothetical protein
VIAPERSTCTSDDKSHVKLMEMDCGEGDSMEMPASLTSLAPVRFVAALQGAALMR